MSVHRKKGMSSNESLRNANLYFNSLNDSNKSDKVFIEDSIIYNHAYRNMTSIQMKGVISSCFDSIIYNYNNQTWKKDLGIRAKNSKQVKMCIRRLYNTVLKKACKAAWSDLSEVNQDVMDSFMMFIAHIRKNGLLNYVNLYITGSDKSSIEERITSLVIF